MLITFDLDGVLMENPFSEGVFPEVTREIAQSSFQFHKWNLEQAQQKVFQEMLARYYQRFNSQQSFQAYNWQEIINEVAQEFDYQEPIDVEEILKNYCHPPYIRGYDNGVRLIEELKTRKIKVGIITNGYQKYQEPVLKALGFAMDFEFFISADSQASVKPQAEMFAAAKKHTKWIHVGDSLYHDVFGCNQAGGVGVWVYRGEMSALKNVPLLSRVNTPVAQKIIQQSWRREKERYQITVDNNQSFMPTVIIDNLQELLLLPQLN